MSRKSGKPLFSIDMKLFRESMGKVIGRLDDAHRMYLGAFAQAIFAYGNDLLAEASQKSPIDKGALRKHAEVTDPRINGVSVEVDVGFNMIYAAIQDQGGTVEPVHAKALFIPLKKGATPGDKGLVFGEDFILAKKATLKGTRYLSGTFDSRKATASDSIAKLMQLNIDLAKGKVTT